MVRALFAILMVPGALVARDVTQPDYTLRAPFGQNGQSFSADQRRFDVNRNISDKRFPVTEWHAHFSNIGRQQARIDMSARDREVLTHQTLSFDSRDLSMSRYDGRQAYIRNQANIERAMDSPEVGGFTVRRFEGPMSEVRSELGDASEVSMEELNRFFYMRNRAGASETGDIPVNQAGSGN